MNNRGLELLSPAGDLNTLKTVVSAGADAVYFGGDLFGARAFAKNFTTEEAEEGIRYAHLFQKKCFLTVNTLLKNVEMERQLYTYLKRYYEIGIDGILVQDLGVLAMLREYFPDIPIHASTQMSSASQYGVEFLKKLDVKRVVLARELSLAEMKEIYEKTGMELEAFLHGALCVCYSGNCYMSSLIGGRSGNRGRCAQPCRLPYVVDQDKKPQFWLSPKDLSALHRIPDLYEAGIYSLKLEGRMKSIAYADAVTSLYRKYVDLFLSGEEYVVSKEDEKLLLDAGNRTGFTDHYLDFHNGKDMMALSNSSHSSFLESGSVSKNIQYELSGELTAFAGQPLSLHIYSPNDPTKEIFVSSDIVEQAENHPSTREELTRRLMKTGDTDFTFKSVEIFTDDHAFVVVSKLNELRRQALRDFSDLFTETHNKNYKKFTERKADKTVPSTDLRNQSITISIQSKEQYFAIRKNVTSFQLDPNKSLTILFPHRVLFEEAGWLDVWNCYEEDQNHHIAWGISLPPIIRSSYANELKEGLIKHPFSLYEASSMDGLGFLESLSIPKEKVLLGSRIYSWSNRTIDFFREEGYHKFVAPIELNEKELSYRDNKDSSFVLYGYLPMMIMANCTRKNRYGCDHKPSIITLQDRKRAKMKVYNDCSICMNTIYNSLPMSILSFPAEVQNLDFGSLRLDFTIENVEQTEEVLRDFWDFIFGDSFDKKTNVTYGHFHRGVD